MNLEEKRKEFEDYMMSKQGYKHLSPPDAKAGINSLWSRIEQLIKEACKKQREETFREIIDRLFLYGWDDQNEIIQLIEKFNAP